MDLTQEQLEAAFAKGLQGFEEKLAAVADEKIDSKLKELGLDKLDLKAPFHGATGDEEAATKSKKERGEKIAKFIRSVKLGDRRLS